MQKDRTKIGIRIERTNTKIDKNKSKQINIKSKKQQKTAERNKESKWDRQIKNKTRKKKQIEQKK